MNSPFRRLRGASVALTAAATMALSPMRGGNLSRIHIVGTEFRTEAGEPVWLNGINTAWVRWNDFGGDRFDPALWEEEFRRYADAGVNCARIWLDCDGEVAVDFDHAGLVTGPAGSFVSDVERMLDIAGRFRIHVLAVLMSFDHVKPTHPRHTLWRAMFNDDARRDAYLRRFVEPVARRFADNPALLAWEICNEPEWIWFKRYGVSRERVVAFHGHAAAALHRVGARAVTTGSASWRWHGEHWRGGVRVDHPWSDARLGAVGAGEGARLDFFQVHYYDWMALLGWSPYARGGTPGRFLSRVDRPVIIGETRGRHSWLTGRSVEGSYSQGAANGYAGVFGWSAHGRDGHGNFEEIATATRAMAHYRRESRHSTASGDALIAVRTREAGARAMAAPEAASTPAGHPEPYERLAMAEAADERHAEALPAGEPGDPVAHDAI